MEYCESVCGSSHNFKHCLNVSVRQCLRTDQHRLTVYQKDVEISRGISWGRVTYFSVQLLKKYMLLG